MPKKKKNQNKKQLKYGFNMFPAKTVFSIVSATQLGICKGELLK